MYELTFYDEFIDHHLHDWHPAEEVPRTDYDLLVGILSRETREVHTRLNTLYAACQSPDKLQVAVRNHQQALVTEADRLMPLITSRDVLEWDQIPDVPTAGNLARHVFNEINELLSFLRLQFPDHFCKKSKLPGLTHVAKVLEWGEKLDLVEERMQKLGMDRELLDLALAPILPHMGQQVLVYISWRKCDYYSEFLASLLRISDPANDPGKARQQLIDELFRLNFNDDAYIAWRTRHFEIDLCKFDTWREQEAYLMDLRMHLTILPERKDLRLWNKLPSVKEILMTWVDARLENLRYKITHQPHASQSPDPDPSDRIPLACNLRFWGMFIRMMVELGIIDPTHKEKMIQVFAANFVDSDGNPINKDTLYSRYKNPEVVTLQSAQSLPQKITDWIESRIDLVLDRKPQPKAKKR